MKKSLLIGTTALIILLAGYTAAGPFITVYQIKSAVNAHDGAALAEQIDFPALRGNLQQQIDRALRKKTGAMDSNHLFGLSAAGVTASLSERVVNLLVTPKGLESLMTGVYPKALLRHSKPAASDTSAAATGPFSQVRYTYDDWNTFSIWVKSSSRNGEIRFVLTRRLINWKLSNIVLTV